MEAAKVIQRRGFQLQILAESRGPRLLLEWLAQHQFDFKHAIRIRVEMDTVEEQNVLIVRLTNVIIQDLREIAQYINLNS